jgi:hypothetical protein
VDPIPDYIGLSRQKWCKKEVAFQNEDSDIVATAYLEFAKECQIIDGQKTLGRDNVGVVVCEVWQPQSLLSCHTLWPWPIQRALFEGVSFYNHLRKEQEILAQKAMRLGDKRGSRKYLSGLQNPQAARKKRKDCLIDIAVVNDVVSKDCCSRMHIHQFDAP